MRAPIFVVSWRIDGLWYAFDVSREDLAGGLAMALSEHGRQEVRVEQATEEEADEARRALRKETVMRAVRGEHAERVLELRVRCEDLAAENRLLKLCAKRTAAPLVEAAG